MNTVITKCDFVQQVLKKKITGGEYPPGTKIPTEPEIVSKYGVGRNTVREAISTLVHEGLLEKIQGKGTFVRENSQEIDERRKLAHSMTLKELSQLYDVRSALEGLAGRLACDNLTEKDIEDLRQMARDYKDGMSKKDLNAVEDADLRFHRKIINLSKNIFLIRELNEFSILKRFFFLEKKLVSIAGKDMLSEDSDDPLSHEFIIDALEKRDKDECENILRRHIQRAKLNMLEQGMGIKLNPFEKF